MKLNKNGFTMIELLAVFVILGILSMITIPAVTRYIGKARQKDYDALATSAYNAAANYIMQNDGEYTSTITFDDLEKNDLISNLKDPIDNSKDCGGFVTVSKDESDSIFANYEYSVSLCCSQYKYKYSFNVNNTNDDETVVKKSKPDALSDSECAAYIKSSPSPSPSESPSPSPSYNTSTTKSSDSIVTTINFYPNGTTFNSGKTLKVNVTCNSNGKCSSSNTNYVTVSGKTASLKSVSISGWTFAGWATSATAKSNFSKTVTVGVNKTYNYYLRVYKTFKASYSYKQSNTQDLTSLNTSSSVSCKMYNGDTSCKVTLPNPESVNLGGYSGICCGNSKCTANKCNSSNKRKMNELFTITWKGDGLTTITSKNYKDISISNNVSYKINLVGIKKTLYVASNDGNLWYRYSPEALTKACSGNYKKCISKNNSIGFIYQDKKGGYFVWTGGNNWKYNTKSKSMWFKGTGHICKKCANYNHTADGCDGKNVNSLTDGWVYAGYLYY